MANNKTRADTAFAGFSEDIKGVGLAFEEDMREEERDTTFAHIDNLPRARHDEIHPDPDQPRNTEPFQVLRAMKAQELRALLDAGTETDDLFRAEHPWAHEVLALARSIREHGLQMPITLRARPNGGYYIVYGERRWTAIGLLIRSGDNRYRDIPFLEESRQISRAERLALQIAEDWHKSKHSVIDTVGAIRRYADEKAGGDMTDLPATEIAQALQIHYKAAQRYLRVAKAFAAPEIERISAGNGGVDLHPLLKLVEWLGEQEQRGGFTPSRRQRAIERFAEERPRASAVFSMLSEFSMGKGKGGPGRPARARYDARIDRAHGITAHIHVPVTKLTPESLRRAETRLEEALTEVRHLREDMFPGASDE